MPKRKSPLEGGALKKPSLDVNGRPKVYTPWDAALSARFPEDKSPRYLVATRTDGDDFKLVKSIVFSEEIEGKFGDLNGIQKLRNGQLLLHTVSKVQTDRLLQCTQFGEIPVKIEKHATLNEVRGVIFHRDLILNSDEDLMRDLKKRGVTKIRRITRKNGEQRVDTGAFVLHFEGAVVPKKVKVTSYWCDVKPYIPPPMRCYQCQKFGHVSSRCSGQAVCSECGKAPHEGAKCTPPPMCTNCQGFHAPRSKECPEYKKEAKIQEIRTLEKLSYRDARKKLRELNAPEFQVSFAAAAATAKPTSPSSFVPADFPPLSSTRPGTTIVPVEVCPKKAQGPSSAPKPKAPVKPSPPVQSEKKSSPTKLAKKPSPSRVGNKPSPTRNGKKTSPARDGKKPSPSRAGNKSSPTRTGPPSSPSKQDKKEKREAVRRRLSRPATTGVASTPGSDPAPPVTSGAVLTAATPVDERDIPRDPAVSSTPDPLPSLPSDEDMEVDQCDPSPDGDGWHISKAKKKEKKPKDCQQS